MSGSDRPFLPPDAPEPEPGGTWQPPTADDATPAPVGPPIADPASTAPFEWTSVADTPEPDERPRRNRWALAGAVVGVLALGAAGIFAVTQITGGTSGGASSPEEVGEAMMASLENEDVLGVMDLLLPGERETFRQPMVDYVSELSRMEVLSDDASLSDLSGVEIEMSNSRVSVSETNVDDVANIRMSADVTATVNGSELPIGDLITDLAGASVDDLPTDTTRSEFDVPMTVVREGDRWYLSLMHTIAEQARPRGVDIPTTGLAPTGGETPEGAVDALLDGVERLDLTAIIASLDPNEAQALQRYAPLFVPDAQRALDEAPLEWQVTGVEYAVSGDGGTRYVAIERLRIDGIAEGQSFGLDFAGGCFVAEAAGERVESCPAQGQAELDELFDGVDAQPVENLLATIERAFDDYDPPPGITVNEVDGRWYVSPLATGFDQALAFMQAVDRQEIEDIGEATAAALDWFFNDFFTGPELGDLLDSPLVLDDDPFGNDEPLVVDDPPPDEPLSDEPPPDEPEADDPPPEELPTEEEFAQADELYWACTDLPSTGEAIDCLNGHVAAGEIPDWYIGVEVRYPECGVADISLGRAPIFDMSDQEYTQLVAAANQCFTELVAAGTISEFEVPPEYGRSECAEGLNPWQFDDARFDEWLDCVYG